MQKIFIRLNLLQNDCLFTYHSNLKQWFLWFDITCFYFINGSAGHHSLLEEHISSKFSPNFFAVLCNSALASGDKCLSDRCLDKRSPPLYSWMGIFPHQYKSIWSLSGRDTILQNSICGANAESYSCLKIPGLCNVTFAIVRIPAPPPLKSRQRLLPPS